jgi:NAD(P)-dependent dehydrogenase (short-subunit alcohol dehydrogenase family)
LAAEFSPQVRVNTVAPGPVVSDGSDPERIEQVGKAILLGRAAEGGEIVEVIAVLASPRASYFTGARRPTVASRSRCGGRGW